MNQHTQQNGDVFLKRPKISIYIAMSIDGYIARKDDGLDWLDRFQEFNEDYGHSQFFSSIDAIVLGRKTYEVVAGFTEWPYKDKRVIVISKTLQSVKNEVELFSGDLTNLVSKLHSEGVKHVWIDGGVTVSQFLKAQLVDQITITLIPIILGSGIPLFSNIEKELPCHLISSQSYPSGLVQLCYKRK